MVSKKEKSTEVLVQVSENIRVIRFDSLNLAIETLEDTIKADNSKVKEWKFYGYYRNITMALQAIINNDLLININEALTLKEYVEKVEASNNSVISSLKENGIL